MKQATIIDYGSGNLHSIAKAFERAAIGKDIAIKVTSDAEELAKSSYIILPGVGAFGDCLKGLNALSGMRDALQEQVIINKKPFLGVCVGMQMLADEGLENGKHQGLGWISGRVKPIDAGDLKIPHMGWNNIKFKQKHPLFDGVDDGSDLYFVHSYFFDCKDQESVLSIVEYGVDVVAAIAKDNIIATQFHPEKSQTAGLKIISNFLEM